MAVVNLAIGDDLGALARNFVETGKVVIPMLGSYDLAEKAAMGFLRFLEMIPEAEREHWSLNCDGNEDPDRAPDWGFICRHGSLKVNGGRYDDKYIFHYRARLPHMFRNAGLAVEPFISWFLDCLSLFHYAYQVQKDFLAELDRVMPGFHLLEQFLDARADDLHVLRILQYSERGPEDPFVIGKGHVDRNLLTFQIAESQPGLRVYDAEGKNPVPYVALPDHVLAFPGTKFQKLTERAAGDTRKILGLNHDIVNQNPVAGRRWSVIFFGHIYLPEFVPRSA